MTGVCSTFCTVSVKLYEIVEPRFSDISINFVNTHVPMLNNVFSHLAITWKIHHIIVSRDGMVRNTCISERESLSSSYNIGLTETL